MSQKALIAMSGGVDSSVAAWLIRKRDMTVQGPPCACFRKKR